MEEQYYDIDRRTMPKEAARELRRKYLRYKDAEIVYSMTHKKLLELAGKAGAIYRIDGYVLLDRDIFDQYLEQFHEAPIITIMNDALPKKKPVKKVSLSEKRLMKYFPEDYPASKCERIITELLEKWKLEMEAKNNV